MGTTAQKLQRVLDTKEGLKDTINTYLGQNITSAIPFKDYETYIKNFYGVLPKTSYAEGSNITLSNCLKGKLDYEDDKVGYGDTKQDSTQGENLLPSPVAKSGTSNGVAFSTDGNGKYTISGKLTREENARLDFPISKTYPAGTYYWHLRNSGTTSGNINISIRSNTSSIAYLSLNATNRINSFTLLESVTIDNIRLTVGNGYGTSDSIDITFEPTIELTDDTTDFEKYTGGIPSPNPSYPQPIQVVTGEQEVVVRGKNALPNPIQSQTLNGITVTRADDGTLTFNGTSTANTYFDFSTEFDTTKYAGYKFYGFPSAMGGSGFSVRVSSSNRVEIQGISTNGTAINDNGVKYIAVRIGNNVTINNIVLKPMLVAPIETDITYEPYITPITKQLSLGDKKLYEDSTIVRISEGNWKILEWHEKKYLKGLNWVRTGTSDANKKRYYTNDFSNIIETSIASAKTSKGLYSNILIEGTANNTYLAQQKISSSPGGELYVYIDSLSGEPTTTALINLLTDTNAYAIIPLAELKETPITDTNLINQLEDIYNIQSVNGTTIVEINGNLPMIIKCRALKGE